MKPHGLLIAGLLAAAPAVAQYRCVENGKTLYTDRPCGPPSAPASGSPKVIGDTGNSAYATPTGAWRGQVQFLAKAGPAVINEAHAVVPFVIDIDPQGQVAGAGNGCSLKGIALPGAMETMMSLDVTLTGCGYPAYNRQMSGRLVLYRGQKYVDFSLTSYDMQRRPVAFYELRGPLRR